MRAGPRNAAGGVLRTPPWCSIARRKLATEGAGAGSWASFLQLTVTGLQAKPKAHVGQDQSCALPSICLVQTGHPPCNPQVLYYGTQQKPGSAYLLWIACFGATLPMHSHHTLLCSQKQAVHLPVDSRREGDASKLLVDPGGWLSLLGSKAWMPLRP